MSPRRPSKSAEAGAKPPETLSEALLEEMRKELARAIPREAELHRLTNLLLSSNKNNARFTVDASHINRLGYELVERKETALAELIKNSYDADATEVTVTFKGAQEPGGTLSIDDDGTGMTREELIDGFMRISSTLKLHKPVSQKRKRNRAGNKGIGRFAVQRLGKRMVLDTLSSKANSEALSITINWEDFRADTDLWTQSTEIVRGKRTKPGTTIRIESLRDAWDTKDEAGNSGLQSLAGQLAPLVQPFPLSLDADVPESDFSILLKADSLGTRALAVSDVYSNYLSMAFAQIDGWVDASGKAHYRIESERLNIDPKLKHGRMLQAKHPFDQLADVRFRAFYFIRGPKYLPGVAGRTLSGILATQGGIRVYRNGFRVAPYGEYGDDWLGLDALYRKRATPFLLPFGNASFLGFVELTDREGVRFQETSSREGLVLTPAYDQLKLFLSNALRAAALDIQGERNRLEPPPPPKSAVQISERLGTLRLTLDHLRTARGNERIELIHDAQSTVRGIERDIKKLDRTYADDLAITRVVASLGISLAEFIHETQRLISFILSDLDDIPTNKQEREQLFTRLRKNTQILQGYANLYETVIDQNQDRTLLPLDLGAVVEDFVARVQAMLARQEIDISFRVTFDGPIVARPMHPAEWSSVLLNLMSNAAKAIHRRDIRRHKGDERGRILVEVGREGRRGFIDFLDNGVGIEPDDREVIFLPFVSKARAVDYGDQPLGLGLGLKIARDVLAAHGGSITAEDPPTGYATRFHIEVPLTSGAS